MTHAIETAGAEGHLADFAFAAAIKSARFLYGESHGTMSRVGLIVKVPIHTKSCLVKGGFRPLAISHSKALGILTDPTVRVYPSGVAWALPAPPPCL